MINGNFLLHFRPDRIQLLQQLLVLLYPIQANRALFVHDKSLINHASVGFGVVGTSTQQTHITICLINYIDKVSLKPTLAGSILTLRSKKKE